MTVRLRGHQSSDHTSRVKLRLRTRSTTSSVAMTIYTIVAHLLVLIAVITQSYGKPTMAESRRVRGKDANIARSYFFDVELIEMLTREQQDKNVVLSPISVKLVLGMLMEGAAGETREQIRRALRLGRSNVEARKTIRSWVEAANTPARNSTLNLATHMFVSNSLKLNPNYEKVIWTHYGSSASSLDMSDGTTAAKVINDWVQDETNGVINKLVDESQIGHDTYGILTSAVYFKGSWKKPFAGKTVRCFYKTENKCTNTVFMQKRDQLMYAHISSINADVIELPYKDERFSMLLLIPRDSVQELNRDLPREQLHRVLAAMKPADLHIQMPRFTAEFEQDLVPVLSELQIKDVFTKNSNLTGILHGTNKTFSISHILHSAKVIVDEEGSEAAAATEALIAPLIGVDSITADKPFIFFIKDSLSNAILFAGRVSDPEQAPESESPIPQELSSSVNAAPEEVPVQKMQRPGPPAPLGPRKPGRPNGFLSPSSSINFEDGDAGDSLPSKPQRSVTTTTTSRPSTTKSPPATTSRPFTTTSPPPFIREKPTDDTEHEQPTQTKPPEERRTTSPPTFIRKPDESHNEFTTSSRRKTTTDSSSEDMNQSVTRKTTTTDSSEYEDQDEPLTIWGRKYFPGFRVLLYRYYGVDQAKPKRTTERFLFSS